MRFIKQLPELLVTVNITDLITHKTETYKVLDIEILAAVKRAIAINFSSYNADCQPYSHFISKYMDTIVNENLVKFAKKNRFSFSYSSEIFNQ